jgi:O-antigen ligase
MAMPASDGPVGVLGDAPALRERIVRRILSASGATGHAGMAAAAVLLTAVAVGLLRQGAYYASAQLSVGLLLAGAVLLALAARPLSMDDLRAPPTPLLLVLAGWMLVAAAAQGWWAAGLRPALLLAGIVAILLVCRRLPVDTRMILVAGVVTVGLAVATVGWVGVAYRISPWGWQSSGLWRAASTLTYPNAMAAALVPLALFVLALLTARKRAAPLGLAATGLLIGAGATLSRAGLLALLVGGVMLAALLGVRVVAKTSAAPALGAAIALAGLAPSMAGSVKPSPALATITLFAGLVAGAALPRLRRRAAALAAVAIGACGVAVLASLHWSRLGEAAGQVADARGTLSSAYRIDGLRAALRVLADHPLTGAGPGRTQFHWATPDGPQGTLQYAHNEYVQLAAESGIVAVVLLAAILLAIARLLRQARAADGSWASRARWAGVVAAVVALAVHSGFDFVWHVPAIPITTTVLLGTVLPPATSELTRSEPSALDVNVAHNREEPQR